MARDRIHVDPMIDYHDLEGDGKNTDNDQFEGLDSMASSNVSSTTKLQTMAYSVILPDDQPSSDAPKAVLKRNCARDNDAGVEGSISVAKCFEVLCKNSLPTPYP